MFVYFMQPIMYNMHFDCIFMHIDTALFLHYI